jgi:RHS repeat-associated protein
MTSSITLRAKILLLAAAVALCPSFMQASPVPCSKCVETTPTGGGSGLDSLQGSVQDNYPVFACKTSPGSLHFELAYSSQHAATEFLAACDTSQGFGWAHNYQTFLFRQQAAMFRRDGNGNVVKFDPQPGTSPAVYKPTAGNFETMIGNTNGAFTIYYTEGTVEQFSNFPACPYFCKSPIYQMTERVDRNGNTTTLAYDAAGRLSAVTDAYGRTMTLGYDTNNRVQTITDPLGHVTQFAYSLFGAGLLQITDPLGHTVQYQYDSLYRVTSKTNQNGNVFRFTYGNGIVTADYLNPNGTLTFLGSIANSNNWALNAALLTGQLKTEYLPSSVIRLDANSNRWVYTYDTNDEALTIIPPGQASGTSFVYDPATLEATAITDANGNTTYRQYDALGNLLAETNCLGQNTRYTYETNFNQVTSVTDPNGFVTTNLYDAHGNLIQQTDPLGFSQQWTYNVHGSVLAAQDKNGNLTRHYYDHFGECTNTTDALGNVTVYSCDALGNVLSRTDANLNVSTYGYDAMNRLTAATNNPSTYEPAAVPPVVGAPRLAISAQSDGTYLLQWTGSGFVLTRTSDLTRPFDDVLAGGLPVTNSPFQISVPLTNVCEFYCLRTGTGSVTPAGNGPRGPQPKGPLTPHVTFYTYDPDGNRTSVTDANGHTTTYAYDELDLLTYTTNALGYTTYTTNDPAGNKIAETDANGHTTWYAYDAQNRLASTTNALGYVTAVAYDLVGNQVAATDANGHTTMFAYDCLNRLIAITNAVGYVTQYEYDAGSGGGGCGCGAGTKGTSHIIKQTDANGKVTYFKYDPLGRLIKIIRKQGDTADLIDSDDAVTSFTYDPNGNRLAAVDPTGITNFLGYDALNREIAWTNGAGDVTLTSYDPVSNVLTITAPNGNVTTNTYDSLNRLIQKDDSIGRLITLGYDAVGNLVSDTDANTNTTQFAYDKLDRLVATTDPMGNSSTKIFDPVGNLVQSIDRNGNSMLYIYDPLNQQTNAMDTLGGVTASSYDSVGNLIAITDANNHTTTYQYDAVNRRVRESYPDSTYDTRTFTYDGVGNLTSLTDQKGNTTLYFYSDLYYLTNRVYANDPADRFTYDLAGRMLTANKTNWLTTNDWIVTFAYDGANRVTNTIQSGRTIAYVYNIPGRTRSVTYPSGTNIVELTDARARLLSVNDGGATPLAAYSYDLGNRLLTRAYPSGVVAEYAYNQNNWITLLLQTNPTSQSLVAGFAYAYDKEGNKFYEQNLWNSNPSEAYGYDPMYQLTNWLAGRLTNGMVPAPSSSEQWLLDPVGNWNAWITNGVSQTRTHNAVNEIIAIGTNSVCYDANGNLQNDGAYAYAYDQQNRLTQVIRSSDGAVVGQHAYDALGRHVEKIANPAGVSSTTCYLYDNARVVEEQDARGLTQATYTYGNYIDEVLTMDRAGQSYYYHQNALWCVAAITDSTATAVERYAYDAYGFGTVTDGLGNPIPPNFWGAPHSVINNPFFFTGRQLDEETGLYFYRARYYDPKIGRFLQRDSLGYVAGMNLYEYVGARPINNTDPTGLWPWPCNDLCPAEGKKHCSLYSIVTTPFDQTPSDVSAIKKGAAKVANVIGKAGAKAPIDALADPLYSAFAAAPGVGNYLSKKIYFKVYLIFHCDQKCAKVRCCYFGWTVKKLDWDSDDEYVNVQVGDIFDGDQDPSDTLKKELPRALGNNQFQ